MSCYAPSASTRKGALVGKIAASEYGHDRSVAVAAAAALPRRAYVVPAADVCKRGHLITAHGKQGRFCSTCRNASYRAKRRGITIEAALA